MAHPGGTLVSGEMGNSFGRISDKHRREHSGNCPRPKWYIATDGERIIAGAGVIANDFHDRKDLTPNVCALYVEPELRRRGIAGHLLAHICKDMASKAITPLYLITEHTSFYERYGWEYLCMVQGDDGEQMRMYKKDTSL